MSSMLALGIPLNHVVAMATSNAAKLAGMEGEIGTLKVGGVADVSVLEDLRGRWAMHDNEGTQVITERMLHPAFCYRNGERFEATATILPVAKAA
jgi:dihydroorotase